MTEKLCHPHGDRRFDVTGIREAKARGTQQEALLNQA
jgi:hypothetical protein